MRTDRKIRGSEWKYYDKIKQKTRVHHCVIPCLVIGTRIIFFLAGASPCGTTCRNFDFPMLICISFSLFFKQTWFSYVRYCNIDVCNNSCDNDRKKPWHPAGENESRPHTTLKKIIKLIKVFDRLNRIYHSYTLILLNLTNWTNW